MKNRIEDARNHLFETLESLKDEDKPMDIDRAKAICQVVGTIIESGKVEVEFLKVTGAEKSASGFFEKPAELPPARQVKAIN